MNMLSFESSKGFQDKCNCLESLKTTRVWKTTRVQKTTRVWKTIISIENYKTMKRPGSQEVRKSQEGHKSQRRLPSLKKPEPQESGRLADHKSQESREQLLTILLYSLQQWRR
jgi:hypothetical protein